MTAGAGLVELDLSDNAFGPNGMKGLTKLLQSHSCFTLQVLRLHNNGLGTTGGKVIHLIYLSIWGFFVCQLAGTYLFWEIAGISSTRWQFSLKYHFVLNAIEENNGENGSV